MKPYHFIILVLVGVAATNVSLFVIYFVMDTTFSTTGVFILSLLVGGTAQQFARLFITRSTFRK